MSATAVAVRKPFPASYRKTAVLVGVLFLFATATFAAGSSFITSYFPKLAQAHRRCSLGSFSKPLAR